tara:strand:- start:350 stop:559 length:210 start_codon:yes stop_codon:yes gene_type:complete
MNKKIEKLIKESLKDVAIRMYDLSEKDRQSLLIEYKEWITENPNFEDILMLPFEAYTDINLNNLQEESD